MWEYDCDCIPVIATNGDTAPIGIVTDRDIAIAA
jgi:CBS domain-containing protein